MTDDIVTRLGEHAQNCDCTNASFDMQDAADEIERLRALLQRWECGEMVVSERWFTPLARQQQLENR
jgi:hypothetical protein